MPLQLKSAVVRRRLAELDEKSSIIEIQWTRAQWKKWYEKNIAKAEQKDFVYRTKTEEEKDEMDLEEFFANHEQDHQVQKKNRKKCSKNPSNYVYIFEKEKRPIFC